MGRARRDEVAVLESELGVRLFHRLGRSVELTAAGRTDAGVHAQANVISFDAPRLPG